jgi:hypothetical protein
MRCALAGLLAVACHRDASPKAGADASPLASAPDPAVESLVLGGPDAPVASARSLSGDLLVSTPHGLLREPAVVDAFSRYRSYVEGKPGCTWVTSSSVKVHAGSTRLESVVRGDGA